MYILKSKIVFEQVARDAYPERTKSFTATFVNSCEIKSSWADLTDTCKIIMPKNVYFVDETGNKFTWFGKNIIGGADSPILLRGDKVSVTLSYEGFPEVEEFKGYVTRVNNRIPLEIDCEDSMFLLKQIQTPNALYKNTTVKAMLDKMVSLVATDKNVSDYTRASFNESNIKVVSGTATSIIANVNIGDFRTQNDTIASVLDRIKKDYRLYSYFRGNELRCSGIVYYPSDARKAKFVFQRNIISDSLDYKRQDDIQLGATAYSVNKTEQTVMNKSGSLKTKEKRLEVFVGSKSGEIRTLYYNNVTDVNTLKALATRDLQKFYYEGFWGSFVGFGMPSVRHGDFAVISDQILPERNGTYYIKSVTKTFGMNGFRQNIGLHFKVYNGDGSALFTQDQINAGL